MTPDPIRAAKLWVDVGKLASSSAPRLKLRQRPVSVKLHHRCAMDVLHELESSSVDLVIGDPPYFTSGMGADWRSTSFNTRAARAGLVGTLPTGMKFDPKQGRDFQFFINQHAVEILRVLKPGGFFVCFSQARLVHRLGVAIEDAGFEVRDMWGWVYEGQPKAFSQDHFVRKMKISDDKKQEMIARLQGRKTPQLKPMIEPMIIGQKPKDGTFVDNWLRYGVGLIDTSQSLDGKFPGNLMVVPKPNKAERGEGNDHPTVKPTQLLEHIIRMLTTPYQIVFDPFAGSASVGAAAIANRRNYVGAEPDQHYFDIAERRLNLGVTE